MFKHAFSERIPDNERSTAIFDDFVDDTPNRPILLDHILVSPSLSLKIRDSGIAHQAYEDGTDNNETGRQKHVSDHRLVFLDI